MFQQYVDQEHLNGLLLCSRLLYVLTLTDNFSGWDIVIHNLQIIPILGHCVLDEGHLQEGSTFAASLQLNQRKVDTLPFRRTEIALHTLIFLYIKYNNLIRCGEPAGDATTAGGSVTLHRDSDVAAGGDIMRESSDCSCHSVWQPRPETQSGIRRRSVQQQPRRRTCLGIQVRLLTCNRTSKQISKSCTEM